MKIALSKFSFFISVAFIFLLSASFTQSYVWLDENHNQVTQENGKFYRPIPDKKRNVYLIVDFYKNGTKYREGKAESLIANKEVFKDSIEGVDPGAPKNPKIGKKFLITTIITSVIFIVIYYLVSFNLLNLRNYLQ